MLYACDFAWWQAQNGVPEFGGLKISQDAGCTAKPAWAIERVVSQRGDDRLLTEQPGVIGWGGNSGFHCLNLAVQFGAAKIILVGFDMRLDKGVHWHGRHPRGLNNPTDANVRRWRKCIDDAAGTIRALGIAVINASPVSALKNYPKMDLMDALEC